MKPYTHHFRPFTIDRIPGIRLNRELGLQEARDNLINKKSKKKSGAKTTKTKKKKYTLTSKSKAALESATPEVRAMFEGLL